MTDIEKRQQYWRENIRLLSILLTIWFVVSYGFGILGKEFLDQFGFLGFRLGFWFAQQGSIFVFLVLIFVYAWRMNKLDEKYDLRED